VLIFELLEGLSKYKDQCATKLQNMGRAWKARKRMRSLLVDAYEVHYDAWSQSEYYYNRLTGATRNHLPSLLAGCKIKKAPDGWQKMVDEEGNTYYYHARTGRYSWISEEQAIKRLQRAVRNKLQGEFRVASFQQLARSVRFTKTAQTAYEKEPHKLSSLVNYALFVMTQEFTWDKATELLKDAADKAAKHPVVLYALGMCMLANCAYPRRKTAAEAHGYLATARQMDPEREKFDAATESFLKWACIIHPRSMRARLMYALVAQCYLDRFDDAEKYYRQALGLVPEEDGDKERVATNFEEFVKQRYPGGVYDRGGPPVAVKLRGRVRDQPDKEWARWEDPDALKEAYTVYWVNNNSHECRWAEPDWEDVWATRRQRGKRLRRLADGSDLFFDPHTNAHFQYRVSTGECWWSEDDIAVAD
jgi:tetratricopeptide (TPR) repeat protein